MSNCSGITAVRIQIDGHADDLYALSLLFPEGAWPDLYVVTQIQGAKDRIFDRVTDDAARLTFVAGPGCLPLIETIGYLDCEAIAREIIAPLNGYCALADSNFNPVVPVGASWEDSHSSGAMSFRRSVSEKPKRLIVANRHPKLQELMPSRVSYMRDNPLAAHATAVVAGPPSWSDYYRLLEDIAGHRNTSLDRLAGAGLADPKALNEFRRAANNRVLGRHGASKRDASRAQDELMNLLEAREFLRRVVTKWLDLECGGELPRDRVDGGPLRFGLDDCSSE
ncbi:hypothetical protein [Sinorhizobium meliloti]|uniref:hypothetical protein n=1 Tax=Rhizobium meliloti TaxID=382 RepID=UPI003D647BC2